MPAKAAQRVSAVQEARVALPAEMRIRHLTPAEAPVQAGRQVPPA